MRRSDSLLHAMTFADAGALTDPLVAGVHQLFQIRVGEHLRRHITGDAGNLRCNAMRHASPVKFTSNVKEARLYAMRRQVTTGLSQPSCVFPRLHLRTAVAGTRPAPLC